MRNYDEMTREERIAYNREIGKAAADIAALTGSHSDMYYFHAKDLLNDVIAHGNTLEAIIDATAGRIHEIPDAWDRRIDCTVYAWAAEEYTERGRAWNLDLGMHPVHLNAFARELMKAAR